MVKKPSKGRQKIEISKIPKKNHLQVTFSKRRSGLFKKASELCTLCGANVAIIVFSPAGKVFSFGHPDVESIVDRFFTCNPMPEPNGLHLIEAHRNASVRELNLQLTQVLNQLEAEKKRGEILSQMRRAGQTQCWWEAPINELSMPELEQLKVSMEELKKVVLRQGDKLLMEAANPSPFYMINGSSAMVDPIEIERKPSEIHGNVHNFGYGQGFF
ncbi:hypothetical protein PVL29_003420 [Vitis rotundifolia]|uniref:MADS-box domain-containing protein n=1 Tax=Vitis rotundifolia TaxID=103349 RepID=A0AA39E236_VITRO|nr:hypothetical protein PVL29_003420 [Vitis rotundifolia]